MNLRQLDIGATAEIVAVGGEGSLRQHFLDMGLIPGAEITLIKYAPMGDPLELRVHGYELTLRLSEAEHIRIMPVAAPAVPKAEKIRVGHNAHPGLGEDGKYHTKAGEQPLPKGEPLTFALAGNQNSGKTTLFNRLTGSNLHVGNFPGLTVEQKSGAIRDYPDALVTDLPGIYSLSPYSNDEVLSREFLLKKKPSCIINIVDATNIERNLYLTMQLMELDTPIVLALNMMDEVRNNGGAIHINEIEAMLGIPVVPISAAKNEGIEELIHHAIHIAKYRERPGRTDFCDKNNHGGAVHRCLHGIMHLIEDHAAAAEIPLRFAAGKLVEGDPMVKAALKLTPEEEGNIEGIIRQMEEERGLDRAAAMADMRFGFIKKICEETVTKPVESKERELSRRLDRILTGKFTALPVFFLIMAMIFWLTFDVIGGGLQQLLAQGIDLLARGTEILFNQWEVNEVLKSLVLNGVFNGVGSIVSFVPIIVVLFLFLSLLEDSGYMARVAFVMDKLLRKIGLSGRSIVPMLIGFGCTVPSVMAARTLPSARDRKLTIMLSPFMSCTAKLPIYVFFTAAFFPEQATLVMIGLYVTGIVIGIAVAFIAKNTVFKGNAVPFMMELPNYRLPGAANVLHLMWEKAKNFLEQAFTVIFIASIIVWFLQTFDFGLNVVTNAEQCILAKIAGVIAPVFTPLGFGDWRITTALMSGFIAKESVVSSLAVLFGSTAAITTMLTPLTALCFLVFCLLYTPCVASIAAIRRELGRKWALYIILGQCGIAWCAAFILHTVGILIL